MIQQPKHKGSNRFRCRSALGKRSANSSQISMAQCPVNFDRKIEANNDDLNFIEPILLMKKNEKTNNLYQNYYEITAHHQTM